MARHELADQVAVILKRAYPGELDKEELEKQSGLPNADLRKALDSLSEEGELDQLAEGFRWRDPSGEEVPPPESAPSADEPPTPPLRSELVEPGGPTARVILEVSAAFSPEGLSDDEIASRTQAIATEMQNTLGTALPHLGCLVAVERLEVYDEPRVLYNRREAPAPDQQ